MIVVHYFGLPVSLQNISNLHCNYIHYNYKQRGKNHCRICGNTHTFGASSGRISLVAANDPDNSTKYQAFDQGREKIHKAKGAKCLGYEEYQIHATLDIHTCPAAEEAEAIRKRLQVRAAQL